jgi:serine/threonine protein kinase
MLEMIGKGGSSKVYRVVSQKNYTQYALKKVAINMVDDEAMRSYATEIQMLKVRSSEVGLV